ncbi:MAG: hypothetical protein LBT31_02535 [Synergistaceae bacterium]|jgi:cellobiose phosphorylase|nr:hypothetical protein [Synergistaceae bacterium]
MKPYGNFFRKIFTSRPHVGDELPLRLGLFNAEQREEHGRILAVEHRLKTGRSKERLLRRLSENESLLIDAHGALVGDVEAERSVTPAGEWLLDNFYVIEEQIRTARRHLPKGYSRELPNLSNGSSAGLPRVYDIALEAILHGDGRVDMEGLKSFVSAYQSVNSLKLGELWAIPIMLRLALIENLRRVTALITANRLEKIRAGEWADKMITEAAEKRNELIGIIADMVRSTPVLTTSFVAELTRRLKGLGATLGLPITWISQQLSESNLTLEQSVNTENQLQAGYQVSMGNCIGSLRVVDAIGWQTFVEEMSVVEGILSRDPSEVYASMDFTTRDRYRHVVEHIAKKSSRSEEDIALLVLKLANEAAESRGRENRKAHIGYYLIDKGRDQLESLAGMRRTFRDSMRKVCRGFPLPIYLGATALLTVFFTYGLIDKIMEGGTSGWALLPLGALFVLCAGDLAIALVNWLSTLSVTPCILPRLDFSDGIPEDQRTLVVIPAMLTNEGAIEKLARELEVRFLGNREKNLHFSLLTDFCDADEESVPEDESLLRFASQKIEGLNEKYRTSRDDPPAFFLFHRSRSWNPHEGVWMGYERKRGKLSALNAFLRGGQKSRECFSAVVGETSVLSGVKYVITLDADTQLARDSARQFVGAMAHPLNQPRYDEKEGRVAEGYGILQPRVATTLPSAHRSLYSRMSSTEMGIDPYTRAISDVYQDLFGEGSFIGKGIYSLDAFQKALDGRLPENRILSHDLLEGCYARSGLVSDVQLYEKSPSRYDADVARRRRWTRGDWQIAAWVLPSVPAADSAGSTGSKRQKNPLSWLSRWKIFDNLRRSLTAAAMTSLLVYTWLLLASPGWWTAIITGVILIPSLAPSAFNLLNKSTDKTFGGHVRTAGRRIPQICASVCFSLSCLPYEALCNLSEIALALWRLFVSHKKLLQWNPSEEANRGLNSGFGASLRKMWIGPAASVLTALALFAKSPAAFTSSGFILALWFFSPFIAWRISLPVFKKPDKLSLAQNQFLKHVARKTWGFFETFVGPDDNWLPPDNFQEYPSARIAHRTSPTNMGLSLLANLSAYDFGFISAGKLIDRTAKTFETMDALQRHRGHFFNWYDTLTLEPLAPLYVSTVDSGNLAGHLMTLRSGLRDLPGDKIIGSRLFESLHDVLEMASLRDEAQNVKEPGLAGLLLDLKSLARTPPETLTKSRRCLERLADAGSALTSGALVCDDERERWIISFVIGCGDALDELKCLVPWIWTSLDSLPASELDELDRISTLRELGDRADADASWSSEMEALAPLIEEGVSHALERLDIIDGLMNRCGDFSRIEYGFLYDEARRLLTVGYNVTELRADPSCYDLLASEARQAVFVGIAQGLLPQESWFALGRRLASAGGEQILLSWSGSMFEYLMPLLVMPTFEHTLLDETCKATVNRQIAYGRKLSLPWGISECGYNMFDVHQDYQYHAFGVPGLGLTRGLASDFVVAPYASALALTVAPLEACRNLERLSKEGFEGMYGFYEAIDYTPSRLQRGHSHAVVRSFMAHHQGMSLLALNHLMLGQSMQKRFKAEPLFNAALLLLQERIPEASAPSAHLSSYPEFRKTEEAATTRIFEKVDTLTPEVQLLSNGRYHVMLTSAGGGYSRWNGLSVTRWREDATCDNWGTFCYLRDVKTSEFWSATHQPTLKRSQFFKSEFSNGRAEFHCRYRDYDSHVTIVVSPEDDVELRRIRVTNRAFARRTLEATSFAETVLAPAASDDLHPVFSNLFVQTEILRDQNAILCTRRPRSQGEESPWMFHMMVVHDAEVGDVTCETDRARFIGRGRSIVNPEAMDEKNKTLSGRDGAVLDPAVAVRGRISMEIEGSVTIDIVTGVAETREAALEMVGKYHDRPLADRVFDMAWTHSQVLLRQLNASEADAQLYNALAGSIIYATSLRRADSSVLVRNNKGQSGLWGYSISGDFPILLLQIEDPANINLVRQLLRAHAYWRLKGLVVDLIIWNEDQGGYRQVLHDQIMDLVSAGGESEEMGRSGGVFVRQADRMAEEDRVLIQTVARVLISDTRGTLEEQIAGRRPRDVVVPRHPKPYTRVSAIGEERPLSRPDLLFYNGLGGFTSDGREYVITTASGHRTPAPWVNVLANPNFGTVVSESGMAYTWSENAHEFRLTPWGNDPINDSKGEAFYLRDEKSGYFWSPAPMPCGGETFYVTRHGFGYTVFEHTERGIHSEMQVYVALDASVKFISLKVINQSGRTRNISATGYVEWVLGDLRSKTGMYVVTERDATSGAIFAHNPYNTEFPGRTAFFDTDDMGATVSCDRSEFLGRNGTLESPDAMRRVHLSGRVGTALDPCAAIQTAFELEDGQERDVVFRLGVGLDRDAAISLAARFCGTSAARSALEKIWRYWSETLGAVRVETPDESFNVMLNGWLPYQILSCRLWARSGFYQSGGAFGFRDQLQDAMSLIHAQPGLLREQLLLCATRQFREGDVQHWWHPPTGRGVRSRCSDDFLWLPLATCRYVLATGDMAVLQESVPFIDGRTLKDDESAYYDLPSVSDETSDLYGHCVRAILHGLRFGVHGLPLMGSGDWNDGMDKVGELGRGESVWLAFFTFDLLTRFAPLAREYGDVSFAEHCIAKAEELRQSAEKSGWDGAWYARAFFDDGSPLGSSQNSECQIDSIAQSWSVLSGAGGDVRSRMAMESLYARLVRRDKKLVQLLDPPFDNKSELGELGPNPGYIRGYVPGVRENGGQYTHAAVWAAMAFAKLGDKKRAWELFRIINPVNHGHTSEEVEIYKAEPYVMAADVYASPDHVGRGGWSWYTGSASWMYRLMLESLLGVRREGSSLHVSPCLPKDWENITVRYRFHETTYIINIIQSPDGVESSGKTIPLVNDGLEHLAEIRIPAQA